MITSWEAFLYVAAGYGGFSFLVDIYRGTRNAWRTAVEHRVRDYREALNEAKHSRTAEEIRLKYLAEGYKKHWDAAEKELRTLKAGYRDAVE